MRRERGGQVHADQDTLRSSPVRQLPRDDQGGWTGGTVPLPARFRGAGIAVIHQELALVEGLSIAENLFLGDLPRRGCGRLAARVTRVRRAATAVWCGPRPGAAGRDARRRAEAAGRDPQGGSQELAGADPRRADRGPGRNRGDAPARPGATARRDGVACVYITHRLEEVRAIADRVTVLRDGRSVASFSTGGVAASELIARWLAGPRPRPRPRRLAPRKLSGPVLLEASGLDVAPGRGQPSRLAGIGFQVRAGEVVGLAGLIGGAI